MTRFTLALLAAAVLMAQGMSVSVSAASSLRGAKSQQQWLLVAKQRSLRLATPRNGARVWQSRTLTTRQTSTVQDM
jgi:hypothetical protein